MSFGKILQFAKRYALVDVNDYERAFGNSQHSQTDNVPTVRQNLPEPLQDPDVTRARKTQNELAGVLNNPVVDDQNKLHEHTKLWEKYITDLGSIREKERLKRPVPYNPLRDMTREIVDQGLERERTGRQPVAARQVNRLPLPVQRVQNHLEPGRLEASKRQARQRNVDQLLLDSDVYERGVDRSRRGRGANRTRRKRTR